VFLPEKSCRHGFLQTQPVWAKGETGHLDITNESWASKEFFHIKVTTPELVPGDIKSISICHHLDANPWVF